MVTKRKRSRRERGSDKLKRSRDPSPTSRSPSHHSLCPSPNQTPITIAYSAVAQQLLVVIEMEQNLWTFLVTSKIGPYKRFLQETCKSGRPGQDLTHLAKAVKILARSCKLVAISLAFLQDYEKWPGTSLHKLSPYPDGPEL